TAPAGGWKLIVVDNASTDRTQKVLTSFAGRLPLLSLLEPKSGKNFALNSGLSQIEGDLVVLTDDDAFPHPDWLVALRRAADAQPDFDLFGGTVTARWGSPPPDWVAWVNKAAVYTISDARLPEGPVEPHHIFGPNMAVRARVFENGVRFDTRI